MIDIIIKNIKFIIFNNNLFILIKRNISGIVPITDDKNIFFRLDILFNNNPVDNKII